MLKPDAVIYEHIVRELVRIEYWPDQPPLAVGGEPHVPSTLQARDSELAYPEASSDKDA